MCGGYQCTTDKNIPSVSPAFCKDSDVNSQSHVPFLEPAVSTCPGQLPTLKWKPVFKRGPLNKNAIILRIIVFFSLYFNIISFKTENKCVHILIKTFNYIVSCQLEPNNYFFFYFSFELTIN